MASCCSTHFSAAWNLIVLVLLRVRIFSNDSWILGGKFMPRDFVWNLQDLNRCIFWEVRFSWTNFRTLYCTSRFLVRTLHSSKLLYFLFALKFIPFFGLESHVLMSSYSLKQDWQSPVFGDYLKKVKSLWWKSYGF